MILLNHVNDTPKIHMYTMHIRMYAVDMCVCKHVSQYKTAKCMYIHTYIMWLGLQKINNSTYVHSCAKYVSLHLLSFHNTCDLACDNQLHMWVQIILSYMLANTYLQFYLVSVNCKKICIMVECSKHVMFVHNVAGMVHT